MEIGYLISTILVLLVCFAGLDLWRQMAIKSENYWYTHYTSAVKNKYDYWKMGYRLENLEIKLENQKAQFKEIRRVIENLAPKISTQALRQNGHTITLTRQSRIAIHNMLRNDSAVYQIRCETNGQYLRIGVDDFRTDARDVCQVFTSATSDSTGPHTMFDMVSTTDGSFALRSVANGLFVTAVSPPPDNIYAPWKLVFGSATVGIAETFRQSPEGYLYSSLVGGFFTCASGQMVAGNSGRYSSSNHFIFEPVSSEDVKTSYTMVDLSRQVLDIQTKYLAQHQKSIAVRRAAVDGVVSTDNPVPVKICLGVPMTSKGTDMAGVLDSPFWSNLFDSFMKTIDWRSNKYIFKFYLGFDKADALYDTGDAWQDMREEFKHRAILRMTEQQMDEESINRVFDSLHLGIKLMHFDHLEGAPTQVVSQLMLTAYEDGFDYFYQVNDDTSLITPNWAPKLISALAANPSIPNFGVTGPRDSNNEKIFTHAFVHRTHMEVFGHMFPPYFKNWWSDDWISTVYGSEHTFRNDDVEIKHNVQAQKTHGTTRYQVDQAAQLHLSEELRKGHVQIDEWLKKNELPRLPLPNICGYLPSVRFIANAVKEKSAHFKEVAPHHHM